MSESGDGGRRSGSGGQDSRPPQSRLTKSSSSSNSLAPPHADIPGMVSAASRSPFATASLQHGTSTSASPQPPSHSRSHPHPILTSPRLRASSAGSSTSNTSSNGGNVPPQSPTPSFTLSSSPRIPVFGSGSMDEDGDEDDDAGQDESLSAGMPMAGVADDQDEDDMGGTSDHTRCRGSSTTGGNDLALNDDDDEVVGGGSAPPTQVNVGGMVRSSSAHNLSHAARIKRDIPAPLLAAQILPDNVYVQQRVGSILSRGMIVKSDQFPLERVGLDTHVIGAPNFQQIRPFPLYATGQPSVSGIRTVLNLLHLKQNPRRRVFWINLREEPVIYLNNRPFVLRELSAAFHNMSDFAGIESVRLEQIEKRLKQDILDESLTNYGNILVHDEIELREIRACWNSADESTVRTSAEIYSELIREGYRVEYWRVPMTAESMFETKQLDGIVKCYVESLKYAPVPNTNQARSGSHMIRSSSAMSLAKLAGAAGSASGERAGQMTDIETLFVINDQMGGGRSSIGMITLLLLMKHATRVAELQHEQKIKQSGLPPPGLPAPHPTLPGQAPSSSTSSSKGPSAPPTPDHHDQGDDDGLAAYRRGEFDLILKLQRLLKDGRGCKAAVDAAVDMCGKVHHLREVIVDAWVRSEHARADDQYQLFTGVTACYLRRYAMLICFQAYLNSCLPAKGATGAAAVVEDIAAAWAQGHTFSDWWQRHPDLGKLMQSLVLAEESEEGMEDASLIRPSSTTATTESMVSSADGSRTSSDALIPSPRGAVSPSQSIDSAGVGEPGRRTDLFSLLDRHVFLRSGPILSKRTIIKSEYFHFTNQKQRQSFEQGNPNFRWYLTLPLAATAQPNVRGIRNILNKIIQVSARRERRMEAELALASAEMYEGVGIGPHDNARKGTPQPHSSSTLNLTSMARGNSDVTDDGSSNSVNLAGHESVRYKAGSMDLSVVAQRALLEGSSGPAGSDSDSKNQHGTTHPPAHSLPHGHSFPSPIPPATSSLPPIESPPIVWVCLREEPVLFIRSEPFILRDYHHPFRTLPEFTIGGMTSERVEQVEDGFKADVLAELTESASNPPPLSEQADSTGVRHPLLPQGCPYLVVHEETIQRQIRPRFQIVPQPFQEHVQTTREVYEQMKKVGYTLEYYRVPLHVEEVPGLKSFDQLFEILNKHALMEEKVNVVFSCQKGGRRSTMGMVVCVLMLMHQNSLHYSYRAEESSATAAARKLESLNLSVRRLREEEHEHAPDAHGHLVSISAHPSRSPPIPTQNNSNSNSNSNSNHTPASLSLPTSIDLNSPSPSPPSVAADASTSVRYSDDLTNVTVSTSTDADTVPTPKGSMVPKHRTALQPPSSTTGDATGPMTAMDAGDATSSPVAPIAPSSAISASSPPAPSPAPSATGSTASAAASTSHVPAGGLKKSASTMSIHIEEVERRDTRARYGRGEYKGILSLIRILKQGGRVKDEVDVAIDSVGQVINIRDSIAQAKSRADTERQKQKRLLGKALKYLESYAYLICFNAYLHERRDTEEEMRAELERNNQAQQQQQQEESAPEAAQGQSASDPTAAPKRHVQFSTTETEDDSSSSLPPLHVGTGRPSVGSLGSFAADGTFQFPSFSRWISSRPELRKQLEDIHRDAEDALKINLLSITSDDAYSSVYSERCGNVLVNGSILKSDYFMGCVNPNIEQIIDGAINFRPIERFPVAGTGIPTVQGIRGILDFYTAWEDPAATPMTSAEQHVDQDGMVVPTPRNNHVPLYRATTILWLNLREEPILYVHEKPFVLRDSDKPYVNIENTGINTRRLEALERQLRRDILAEAERHRLAHQHHSTNTSDSASDTTLNEGEEVVFNKALLHDEDENGNLIAVWVPNLTRQSVQTPQQQFLRCFEEAARAYKAEAERRGERWTFTASYYRTPITDEQAPSPAALDDIIRYLETARDAERPIMLFNCQMGRGRTTTGLIIACLWCIHRGKIPDFTVWQEGTAGITATNVDSIKRSPHAMSRSLMHALTSPSGPSSVSPNVSQQHGSSTLSTFIDSSLIVGDDDASIQHREAEFVNSLKHGWYKVIQSLVRVLPDGPSTKKQVDRVIDHCGTFQNLRSVVYDTQVLALSCLPRKKPFFVHRGRNYLIRYFFLILINAYMRSEVAHDFKRISFQAWLDDRPETMNILSGLQFPEEPPPNSRSHQSAAVTKEEKDERSMQGKGKTVFPPPE